MKRRGFLGALAGVAVAPLVPVPKQESTAAKELFPRGAISPTDVRAIEDARPISLMNEIVDVTSYGDTHRVFMTHAEIAARASRAAAEQPKVEDDEDDLYADDFDDYD